MREKARAVFLLFALGKGNPTAALEFS